MGGLVNRMLEQTLPFRKLVDVGIGAYGEFACSRATAEWLIAGGMTRVDGRPVSVQIVEQCTANNVICAARFLDEAGAGRSDINGRVKVAA